MESSNKECYQKNIQVSVNEKSFHLINVFVLKACSNSDHTTGACTTQYIMSTECQLPYILTYTLSYIKPTPVPTA